MSEAGMLWRRCSNCKSEIEFSQIYWVCSVSTCNRKRTGLVFCSTSCWDAHLPLMRHREAWALEERSPSRETHLRTQSEEKSALKPVARATDAQASRGAERRPPRRIRIDESPQTDHSSAGEFSREILVVASKLKKYVKERHGMNTSEAVMDVLSDKLREICDRAIRNARADERKTLMDRDF